jgi:protein-tyrosine phosphatase
MIISDLQMTKVTDRIYLGNEQDRRREGLKTPKLIEANLCLVCHPDNYKFINPPDQVTIHVPLQDGPGNKLSQFTLAIELLEALMTYTSKTVLVHCAQGVSRSPTVLATYLACLRGTSFEEEVDKLKELRPIVSPNPVLIELAKEFLR